MIEGRTIPLASFAISHTVMGQIIKKISESKTWMVLIIAALGFLAYAYILPAPFKTMDDYYSIIANPNIRDFHHLPQIFKTSFFGEGTFYRPLVSISFLFEYHFFKLNPFYYNFTNVLLHVLTSLSVFFLVSRVLNNRKIGFWTGLLFAIHPIQWEAVCNVPGRSILLCALFFMTAFHCFVLSQEKSKGRGFYSILSMIAFILSLLAKESAILLPFILISYQYLLHPRAQQKKDFDWLPVLPFFILTVLYLIVRKKLGMAVGVFWWTYKDMFLGIVTFLKSFLTLMAKNILFPVDLYYDHSTPLLTSFRDPQVWGVLGAWLLIVLMGIKLRRVFAPAVLFFISWIIINMAIVSQIVPIKVSPGAISSADHFLYIPSVGFFALMILGYQWLCRKLIGKKMISPPVNRFMVAMFLLFLFLTTIQQNVYARQQFALFKRTLERNPQNNRVRLSFALIYALSGYYKEAEENYREVLKYDPFDARAQIGLGKALCDQGKYLEGVKEYENVRDAGMMSELLKNNKKAAYDHMIELYHNRLALDAQNPQLFYSLGVMYSKTDRLEEAAHQYEKALELKPDYKNALFNLASSLALSGKLEPAARHYEKILSLHEPKDEIDESSMRSLAKIYEIEGDSMKAKDYLNQAEELKVKLRP